MKFFRASTLVGCGVALLLVVGALGLVPTDTLAAVDTGLIPCEGTDCQACHVVGLIQKVINFLIGLSIPIVILLFAWAGVLLFTAGGDNPSRRNAAKKIFQSALIGFVIALGSYLIIETILHTVLNDKYFDKGWNIVNCVSDERRETEATISDLLNEVFQSNPAGGSGVGVVLPPTGAVDSDAAIRFNTASIEIVSSGGCSDKSVSTCTSLEGIQKTTVDQVINLKNACKGCSIIITGGTEAGHAAGDTSHSAGFKVDLRSDPGLTSFIQTSFTEVGKRGDGALVYKDTYGNAYAKEDDHWDVTVVKVGVYATE